MCGGDLLGRVIERTRGVVVGNLQFARRMQRGKRRLRLDGQLIERKMLAGLRQRGRQLARPVLRLLPWPRIDHVEGVAAEYRAGDADGVERLARRMQPPELGQRAIVERLDAERG